jgi:zinc protease
MRKSLIIISVIISFLVFFNSCASTESNIVDQEVLGGFQLDPALEELLFDEDYEPLEWDPAIIQGQLDNGLRYFIQTNDKPENKVVFQLAIAAGSILEEEDQRGVAHFLEHMAFNGTAEYDESELVSFLESLGIDFGADLNAYTSFDETVYYLEIPTGDPDLIEEGIKVLSQWLYYISLEPDAVDRERGVVIEEWRGRRGVRGRSSDFLFESILGNSRYKDRLPIGLPSVVESISVERIRDFYERWYRPDLSAVTIVGNLSEDEINTVEDLIDLYFSDTPPERQEPSNPPQFDEPLRNDFALEIFADPELSESEIQVVIDRDFFELDNPIDYYRYVHEIILIQGINRRLTQIAEQPGSPIRAAGMYLYPFTKHHELYLAQILPKENTKETYLAALELFYSEIEKVRVFGLSLDEIEQQKLGIEQIITFLTTNVELRESGDLADSITEAFVNDDLIIDPNFEIRLYERSLVLATEDTVNSALDDYSFLEKGKLMFLVPETFQDDIPSIEEITVLRNTIAETEWQNPNIEVTSLEQILIPAPQGSSIIQEDRIEDLDTERWELANGVTVLFKRIEDPNDYIQIEGFKFGGLSLLEPNEVINARLINEYLIEAGVRGFSASQESQALAETSANLGLNIGTYEISISADATIDDLDELFNLIYIYMTSINESEDAFLRVLSEETIRLSNIENNPQSLFQRQFSDELVDFSPYSRSLNLEDIATMNLDDLISAYRKILGDLSDFTFVIVGDLEANEVKPLVEQYFGALDDTLQIFTDNGEIVQANLPKNPNAWVDRNIEPREERFSFRVEKGIDPVATLVFYFHNEVFYSWQKRVQAFFLREILGNHLREVIREELGLTYGVGVSMWFSYIPRNTAQSFISLQTDPEQLEIVKDRILLELENVVAGLFPGDLLANQKEVYRNFIAEERVTNDFWLGFISGSYREFLALDLDFHRLEESLALVNSLREEDLIELARALLPFSRLISAELVSE